MWLVLCTVTTLGYGERYPVTAAGRLVMGVVLLVGLTMIAMPLAIIGARFTDRWDKRELSLIVHEMEAKIHAAGVTGEATLAAFRAQLSGGRPSSLIPGPTLTPGPHPTPGPP